MRFLPFILLLSTVILTQCSEEEEIRQDRHLIGNWLVQARYADRNDTPAELLPEEEGRVTAISFFGSSGREYSLQVRMMDTIRELYLIDDCFTVTFEGYYTSMNSIEETPGCANNRPTTAEGVFMDSIIWDASVQKPDRFTARMSNAWYEFARVEEFPSLD